MDYALSVLETKKDTLHISISSNSFCMNQEEENGFREINKRLYDLSDSPKTLLVLEFIWFYNRTIKAGSIPFSIKRISLKNIFLLTLRIRYHTILCRYILGFYNVTATKEQGYHIVHRFKPSDPEDPYLNLIFDNVFHSSSYYYRVMSVELQGRSVWPTYDFFVPLHQEFWRTLL